MYSSLDLTYDAIEIRHLWEEFVTNHDYHKAQLPIRNDILKSWKRCHYDSVNPLATHAREGLTTIELEHLWQESELYLTARPVIDTLFQKLNGTGYLITLNDENGNMIYIKGEKDVLRKTEKMNFTTGMDWSEAAAGTNAIGTSIVTKSPIQIFATEHFCEGFQSMTCSSTPIFQPYTRKVIGAIDITGLWPNGQPHTLGMAVSIAQLIEQELAKLHIEKYNFLTEYFHQKKLQWRNNLILVVSDDFLLINGDEALMKAFKLNRMTDLKEHHDLNIITKELYKGNHEPASLPSQLNQVERLGFRFHDIQMIQSLPGDPIGYAILFDRNSQDTSNTFISQKYNLIGESPSLQQVLKKAEKVAQTDVPVLLIGETGTGKEEITRMIHEESNRKRKPFIAMNCGAAQKELIASELFGYEGGTFTGGNKEGKKGKFEEANGGTLFLDEIGEMPFDQQVLLLRVLEEKEITRLGSSKTIKVDVRIIAATNKDLLEMVEKGQFRRDLYFRLNVVALEIPPLRDRKTDILHLANHFIARFTEKYYVSPSQLSKEAIKLITNYQWPGNIRELRNAMEHAVIFSSSAGLIEPSYLPDYLLESVQTIPFNHENENNLSLADQVEKQQISELLKNNNWNISAVSKEMDMARSTLYRKIEKYKLHRV